MKGGGGGQGGGRLAADRNAEPKGRDGKWKTEDGLREKRVPCAASGSGTRVAMCAKRRGVGTACRTDEPARAKTASRSCGARAFFLSAAAVCSMQVALNAVHTGPWERRHAALQAAVGHLHNEAEILPLPAEPLGAGPIRAGDADKGPPRPPR